MLLKQGEASAVFPVTGEPLTIGREPRNRLVLSDERASKRHAVVLLHEGRPMVEDLDSLNGTRVNEQKVATQPLVPGDVLRIGLSVFVLIVDNMPLPCASGEAVGWLIGRKPGGGGGLKFPVARRPILIGRAPEVDLRLRNEDIAEYHAQVSLGPDGPQCLELKSCPPNCVPLADGARMSFGGLALRFRSQRHLGGAKENQTPPPSAGSTAGPRAETEGALPSDVSAAPFGLQPAASSDASLLRHIEEEVARLDREADQTAADEFLEKPSRGYPLAAPGRLVSCAITATSGPLAGKTFEIGAEPLTVGSDPTCHVRLPDAGAPTRHACFRRKEGDPIVEDLGSDVGVLVNGERVRRRPLKPGDVVRIGSSEFLVHL